MKIIKKLLIAGIAALSLSLLLVETAAAHVVVNPSEVTTATRQTFAVSVPNEHNTPVVGVRLVIPDGLESVRPFAKTGWDISTTKTGEGEEAVITEISWKSAGATVPVDLKDEFLLSAKTPAAATELKWKAYETYQDGTAVAWEQEPSESEASTPYSVTKVVNQTEAESAQASTEQTAEDAQKSANRALYLGIVALALGATSLVLVLRKK